MSGGPPQHISLPSISRQSPAELGGPGSVLLRQRRDHAELDGLMNAWLAAGADAPSRDRLWRDFVRLVFSHAFAEETVLWPVLRRVAPDGEELTRRVEEEHQAVNDLLARVEADKGDPRRAEWIEEAFRLVREDIRDEEDLLLPRLRAALDDRRLRRVGAVWEAVRLAAPTRPHPALSRRPPGNALAGVPLSGFDRLRDLIAVDSPTGRRAALALAALASGAAVTAWARRTARRRGSR
ncbi:hemerythrin domain-containing protein [Streptomyces sp. NPDC005876]|uniref:hemerythrin domain-containing protein n=1 Tax=Streptomyces sp. NPDC005876 TaxID=3157076 RepID=UPI0033CE3BE1